jgi:tight adherence protein B
MIPGMYLTRSINRRRLQFEKQLVDVLVLINGAVRAGFSLLQALEVVAKQMKAPASEEFKRVNREVGLGLPTGQALKNLCERMDNDDLNLVVTAVNINYQVGGNLSTMLEAVTETIRERLRLFGEVRVLTTQQRYTSYLLTSLPFFVGAMIFLLNPDHMRRLFEPQLLCIPIGAVFGILLGNFVIRRMVKIEV